jgi:lycopene cyclase CruA
MRVIFTDYLELPAPLATVVSLLRDPALWTRLPTGATRLGTLWQYANELYDVQSTTPPDEARPHFRWLVAPAGGSDPRLEISVTLSDAVVSSHALITLILHAPQRVWPWQRIALQQKLRATVRDCVAQIATLLQDQVAVHAAAPAQPVLVGDHPHGNGNLLDADDLLLNATPAQIALVERLQAHYPQTVSHFVAMRALDHLERVERLEQGWQRIMGGAYDAGVHALVPTISGSADYDLIYAGGGLGLLHATVMAQRYGRRVLVFDRSEVGCVHREWNISRDELHALVDLGVITWDELDDVIMREYRDGLVRFYNGPHSDVPPAELWLPEVLNVALDAGALLRLMRQKFEAAGGTVRSGRAFRTVRVSTHGPLLVEVELEHVATGTIEHYRANLLLDGMGSTSPLALLRHAGHPFAGVCPTVGTVAEGFAQGPGLDEYDPTLGDILVSVADAQDGEQLMWEGFPGRGDEMTVYLFYYSAVRAQQPANRYSLLALFERYFQLLPTYKRLGPHFSHIKPVYGYIPARHSLRTQEAPLLRGVLPVGDSAAQQSPLTFCGFGSHVRNLNRTTSLLEQALRQNLVEPEQLGLINAFQVNVSLNWVFSRFMEPWDQAHDVNRLQNIFYEVLLELGVERSTRFFRDRMRWRDYHPMLFGTLRRYPTILLVSLKVLGVRGIVQWAGDYARFSREAAVATLAHAAGPQIERWLISATERLRPALSLRLRAHYAEWRAMGWIEA